MCVCVCVCVCVYRNNNIPSLDAVLNEDSNREQYKRMSELVAQQIELETKTSSDSPISPSHPPHLSHPHSFHPTQLEPPHRSVMCVCVCVCCVALGVWELPNIRDSVLKSYTHEYTHTYLNYIPSQPGNNPIKKGSYIVYHYVGD